MKKRPVVSIIIPVYNGEKYLDICFKSILNQDYKNIEVIVVNDDSTDGSLKILQKYKKKYSNFVIINQKNTGQAIARNNGIKKATGDYLTFLDQDDYLDNDYISTLVNSIEDNDILITGYKRVDVNGKILYEKKPKKCEWSKFKYCASWSKLYKTSIIRGNNIEFGKYKIGEDVYFLLQACSKTKKVKVLTYAGYNNLQNLESVPNNINKKKDNNKLMPILNDMVKNIDFSNFDQNLVNYFFLKTTIHYIYNQRKNSTLNEYKELFNEYWDWLEKYYKKNNAKIKVTINNDEETKINLLINLFIICKKVGCIKFLLWLIKKFTPETNK